jgi:hypothetical protein
MITPPAETRRCCRDHSAGSVGRSTELATHP